MVAPEAGEPSATRLEKHRLVKRLMCDSDRRGVFVAVTDEGLSRHAEARKTHLEILADHLDR